MKSRIASGLLLAVACGGSASLRQAPARTEEHAPPVPTGPACTEARVLGRIDKVWDDSLAVDGERAFVRLYGAPQAGDYYRLVKKPEPHGIWEVPFDGRGASFVFSAATGIFGTGIAKHGADLVTWSEAGPDLPADAAHPHGAIVWRVPAAGGQLVRIAVSPNACAPYGGLVVDGDVVYFAHIGCDLGPGLFARVPLAGGSVEPLWTGSGDNSGVHDFAIARNVAYLVVGGQEATTVLAIDLASVDHTAHTVYAGPVRAVAADSDGVFVATSNQVLRVDASATSPPHDKAVADVARVSALTLTSTAIFAATERGLVRIPRAAGQSADSPVALYPEVRAGRAFVAGRNVYWVAGSPPRPDSETLVVTAECR
jgi:hypothetical protein